MPIRDAAAAALRPACQVGRQRECSQAWPDGSRSHACRRGSRRQPVLNVDRCAGCTAARAAPKGERNGNYQTGRYTAEAKAERRELRALIRELRRFIDAAD
jgi:hypothetical protein